MILYALCPLSSSAAEQLKNASSATRDANAALLQHLPFADRKDFEDARRGFIAGLPDQTIRNAKGGVVWSMKNFSFLDKEAAPDTVNPSLWRMAKLNMNSGLFAVTDRIYQVRGLDLSNMTIIEGDTGLIIIDPLSSIATATAALELYRAKGPDKDAKTRPVKAVIYTHSHVDHYGGVKGVVSEQDVATGKTAVLAPEGFLEEAVSENVFAGNAMTRRALYMYGALLPYGEKGRVDAGLGKTSAVGGLVSLIAPTDSIRSTGEKRVIDGVEFEFQMAPDTEAPAEMLLYLPRFKALGAAEDATHTLHNLYTLRGAKVRDANKWWKALDEALDRFGGRAEVLFGQHHWPVWGVDNIRAHLKIQRNGYKFLHDQTLRLANMGYTPTEISEALRFPPSLDRQWSLHGYYGTVSHNVKAVYQHYLGWFDGNPANLNPLPPVEAARRYVEFMGGAGEVVKKAKEYYDKGEYRWVAEVLKHVVFVEPANMDARSLQADAFEQLGYQAESGPWRGFYLTGAQELRYGLPHADGLPGGSTASPDTVQAMTAEMILDFLAIHLNADRAEGKVLRITWVQPDTRESYALTLENSVLLYKKDATDGNPDATLTMPRAILAAIAGGRLKLEQALGAKEALVSGNAARATEFFELLDEFSLLFPIVSREFGESARAQQQNAQ
ncbi:MAG: MBL fold metallo-hydrolase [Desulfovibrio sp.]|jgi:alkyl sulfatase BDS1-like metallo-beta-lactamase superfamily hydrolase|nr:MBL fold metallo-hydrolase [Desulfovibrio sp.]